jgi:hypothetical protein
VSTADDGSRSITVDIDKDKAKNGPTFDDDQEITPEFEREVYSYYGLEYATEDRGSYGETTTATDNGFDAGVATDEDELRVQRSEEELTAGTREREAGALRVPQGP